MIDAEFAVDAGTSVLTVYQNAVVPILSAVAVVIGSLIALYFLIKFTKKHVVTDGYDLNDIRNDEISNERAWSGEPADSYYDGHKID